MTPAGMSAQLRAGVDGPHDDERTAEVAELVAGAVRFLNYATRSEAGLTYPATAYAVLGSLTQAASGLPHLAGRVTDFLDGELAAGRLGDDRGRDPVLAVERARRDLEAAARAAGLLARALEAAQADIACLHQRRGDR